MYSMRIANCSSLATSLKLLGLMQLARRFARSDHSAPDGIARLFVGYSWPSTPQIANVLLQVVARHKRRRMPLLAWFVLGGETDSSDSNLPLCARRGRRCRTLRGNRTS